MSKSTLTALPESDRQPAVVVRGDAIHIDGFVETDPDVVHVVRDSHDPDAVIHKALQIGGRALTITQASVDTHIVSTAFSEMTGKVARQLEHVEHELADLVEGAVGEDGHVPAAVKTLTQELDGLLGKTFDPDSKQSVIAKIEKVLGEGRKEQTDAVRRLVDPHDPDSPLGKTRVAVVKAVREETERIRTVVTELSEKIAVQKAEVELLDKTSGKGLGFEEVVHELVGGFVTPLGDLTEKTGRTPGSTGSQVGDEVVTVNPDDTLGRLARYTLECKDRRVSLPAILDELDEALRNREAEAAIAVFSRAEHCPTGTSFCYHDNRAIVVYDKADPDPSALQLAVMWARWVVRRGLAAAEDTVDLVRVEAMLDEAIRALDRAAVIRRCHTGARKKIEEATGHVGAMVEDVEAAVASVREALRA